MNLSGIPVQLAEYTQTIRQTVYRNVGIRVSIGIGPTKVLAKTANHYGKKVPENNGVYILDIQDKIMEALKIFEIGEVWGIGRQYAAMLHSMGVKTAWDFTQMPEDWVKKQMTVVGLRIKKELEGIPCLKMELIAPTKKAKGTMEIIQYTLIGFNPRWKLRQEKLPQCYTTRWDEIITVRDLGR